MKQSPPKVVVEPKQVATSAHAAFDKGIASITDLRFRATKAVYLNDTTREEIAAIALEGRQLLASGVIRHLTDQLLDVGRVPASRQTIAEAVAVLVAAYPSAQRHELGPFAKLLVTDIADFSPTAFALERAMLAVRRAHKFLPSIAEVLEELGRAEDHFASVANTLEEFPLTVQRIEACRDSKPLPLTPPRGLSAPY